MTGSALQLDVLGACQWRLRRGGNVIGIPLTKLEAEKNLKPTVPVGATVALPVTAVRALESTRVP